MRHLAVLCLLVLALASPRLATGTDQNRPVMDVIIVDTNDDLDGFLDKMKRLQGVADRLDLDATLRVFRNTFAADQTGEVRLYWELPSFRAFADAETKLHNDAEFLAILKQLDEAGQGFESELLSIEITRK